jgi:hypothetical protein
MNGAAVINDFAVLNIISLYSNIKAVIYFRSLLSNYFLFLTSKISTFGTAINCRYLS